MFADTPTPSECGDIERQHHSLYVTAFWFWVELQLGFVHAGRFLRETKKFDRVPGVDEYFRELCHFNLVQSPSSGIWSVTKAF
jgi:hypothetical protein